MKGCGLTIRNQGSNTSSHLQLLLSSFVEGKSPYPPYIIYIYMYLILPVHLFFPASCMLKSEFFSFLLIYTSSHICPLLTTCMTEFLSHSLFNKLLYFGDTSSALASSTFVVTVFWGGSFFCFFVIGVLFCLLARAVACGKYPLIYYSNSELIDTYESQLPDAFLFFFPSCSTFLPSFFLSFFRRRTEEIKVCILRSEAKQKPWPARFLSRSSSIQDTDVDVSVIHNTCTFSCDRSGMS